jgi:hypothetical protein
VVENNLFRYVQFPRGAHACGRCKAGYVATGMSFFDEAWCCPQCLEDEKLLPGYAGAREVERREVAAGNLRYPGIGLAAEDRRALGDRLKARRPAATCRQLALYEAGETPASDAA